MYRHDALSWPALLPSCVSAWLYVCIGLIAAASELYVCIERTPIGLRAKYPTPGEFQWYLQIGSEYPSLSQRFVSLSLSVKEVLCSRSEPGVQADGDVAFPP
jgi:hypothetical protein